MPRRAPLVLLFALGCSVAVSGTALAQDKPYSPRKATRSELISFGTYDESPIVWEWEVVSSTMVPNQGRSDFEEIVDASYEEVTKFFEEAFSKQQIAGRLKAKMLPGVAIEELRVMGVQPGGNTSRYTIGHPKLTTRFIIDVEAVGDKCAIRMGNAAFTKIFGGVMPARVGFKPRGAKTIPLNWE